MFAHLEGAEQVTLDGVFHSVDKPDDWYGSEGVVDRWLDSVASEVSPRGSKGGGGGMATISELFSTPFANLFNR